ncbi:hypothetical protein FQZ97_1210400 [compost metagenome]
MQQAFGRALPVALVLTHLDQFTGKGQVFLGDGQGGAQCVADAYLGRIDIAFSTRKAVDLVAERFVFFLTPPQRISVFIDLRIVVRNACAQRFGVFSDGGSLCHESSFVSRRCFSNARQ